MSWGELGVGGGRGEGGWWMVDGGGGGGEAVMVGGLENMSQVSLPAPGTVLSSITSIVRYREAGEKREVRI